MDTTRFRLCAKWFPGFVAAKYADFVAAIAEAKEWRDQHHGSFDTRPQYDMLIQHAIDALVDLSSSELVPCEISELLHNAVVAQDADAINRIIEFRNEYAAAYRNELPLLRACIDEHLPPSLHSRLVPP